MQLFHNFDHPHQKTTGSMVEGCQSRCSGAARTEVLALRLSSIFNASRASESLVVLRQLIAKWYCRRDLSGPKKAWKAAENVLGWADQFARNCLPGEGLVTVIESSKDLLRFNSWQKRSRGLQLGVQAVEATSYEAPQS